MKDRLGQSAFWNRPLANPTQNIFRRFVRMPGSGLPDLLDKSKKAWKEFENRALKTRLEEL